MASAASSGDRPSVHTFSVFRALYRGKRCWLRSQTSQERTPRSTSFPMRAWMVSGLAISVTGYTSTLSRSSLDSSVSRISCWCITQQKITDWYAEHRKNCPSKKAMFS